jgi:hypothetical protein
MSFELNPCRTAFCLTPIRQLRDLHGGEKTPFAGIKISQADAGNPDALELQNLLPYFLNHAPDLPVFSFLQNDAEAPEGNAMNFGGAGAFSGQAHAFGHFQKRAV